MIFWLRKVLVKYRSKLEARCAQILKENNISFEYEPLKIEYIPKFEYYGEKYRAALRIFRLLWHHSKSRRLGSSVLLLLFAMSNCRCQRHLLRVSTLLANSLPASSIVIVIFIFRYVRIHPRLFVLCAKYQFVPIQLWQKELQPFGLCVPNRVFQMFRLIS